MCQKDYTVILIATILSGLIFSCSNREHLNPLDPNNPETEGRLKEVRVTSNKHVVTLRWDAIDHSDITGYSIWRRLEGERDWTLIRVVSPDSISYSDRGLAYYRRVAYRLSVAAEGYESPLSDSVSITPGPNYYWVADYYSGKTSRLTYDGLHTDVTTDAAGYPVAIDADSTAGVVWIIDALGYLVKVTVTGIPLLWIDGLSAPADIILDAIQHTVWISDRSRTSVVRIDTSGIIMGWTDGFSEISEICTAGGDGGIWLADAVEGDVWRMSPEGNRMFSLGDSIGNPSAISYAFRPGVLWIANGVFLLVRWDDGRFESVFEAELAIQALSVQEGTGDCWIVIGDAGTQSVMKISLEGDVLARLDGFSFIRSLAANPFDGGCLVADAGNQRTVRLSEEGLILGVREGYSEPWDVDLE